MNKSHGTSYRNKYKGNEYNGNIREGYVREDLTEKVIFKKNKTKQKQEGGKGLNHVDILTKELQV